MVTILLKTMINNNSQPSSIDTRIKFLEKILTALIIVLTKEHYYNVNNFNNKLFFKLMFNILYVGQPHPRTSTGTSTASRTASSPCC